MNELIKAEILWTRKCLNQCSACAMATGRENTMSIREWQNGILNLQGLGCKFIAFYGAEPLAEFQKLAPVVGYAEERGIHTTIITSGMVPHFFETLKYLHDHGARSLSMSYDIVPYDKFSKQKTYRAKAGLKFFQSLGCRDVAAIVTLTRENFMFLPDTIDMFSKEGIWTFFDVIHADRGQPGSKCKNFDGIDQLMFREDDLPDFKVVVEEVLRMKQEGKMCHASPLFLKLLTEGPAPKLLHYNWNCAVENAFPAWVTVDSDGVVYPCDDFCPPHQTKIKLYNLHDNWGIFADYWTYKVANCCPGCAWNTHIDAIAIKQGQLPLAGYIHGMEDKNEGQKDSIILGRD